LTSDLRTQAASSSQGINQLLRDRVKKEVLSLSETESKFRELSAEGKESAASIAFFSDLHATYSEVLSGLATGGSNNHAKTLRGDGMLLPIAYDPKLTNAALPLAALATIRAFEGNALAFALVAETGSLTFDLSVSTVPQGATISYKRRGDEYKINPSPTNSVIRALPRAIWQFHFHMTGYDDKDVEFDSIRDSDRSLTVVLTRK